MFTPNIRLLKLSHNPTYGSDLPRYRWRMAKMWAWRHRAPRTLAARDLDSTVLRCTLG